MAWTSVTFKQDTNIDGDGTTTAVFTYPDSSVFVFAERANLDSGRSTFVTNAKAAESEFSNKKSSRGTRESALLAELNA